jgi:hypothetical protein
MEVALIASPNMMESRRRFPDLARVPQGLRWPSIPGLDVARLDQVIVVFRMACASTRTRPTWAG